MDKVAAGHIALPALLFSLVCIFVSKLHIHLYLPFALEGKLGEAWELFKK